MKYLFSIIAFLFFTNCIAQKRFGAYNTFESKAFATHYDKANHVKKVYKYCVDNDSVKKIVSIDSIDANGFVSKGWFYKFRTDSIVASFKINRTEKEVQSIEVEITPKSEEYKRFQEVYEDNNWIRNRFKKFNRNESLKFLMRFAHRDTCYYYTDYFYLDGKFADRIYDTDTTYCGKIYPIEYVVKRYLSNFNKDSIIEYDFPKRDYNVFDRFSPDSTLAESTTRWKNDAKIISNQNRIESQFYFYNKKKKIIEEVWVSNNKISGRNLYSYYDDTILKSYTICNTPTADSSYEKYLYHTIWNKAGKEIFFKKNFFNDYTYLAETYKWNYNQENLLTEYVYTATLHHSVRNSWDSKWIYEYEFYDDKKTGLNK